MNKEQIIVFQVGNDEYAVPISLTKAIVNYQNPISILNAPNYIKGMNLAGKVVPVIELAAKLNLTAKKYKASTAIVLSIGVMQVAIAVDYVSRIMTFSNKNIETFPGTLSNKVVRGFTKDQGCLLILLDVDELLNDERVNLKNVTKDKYDFKYRRSATDFRTGASQNSLNSFYRRLKG